MCELLIFSTLASLVVHLFYPKFHYRLGNEQFLMIRSTCHNFVKSLFSILHAVSITRHVCGVHHMSRVTDTQACVRSLMSSANVRRPGQRTISGLAPSVAHKGQLANFAWAISRTQSSTSFYECKWSINATNSLEYSSRLFSELSNLHPSTSFHLGVGL